jgi:hypothetical protein
MIVIQPAEVLHKEGGGECSILSCPTLRGSNTNSVVAYALP